MIQNRGKKNREKIDRTENRQRIQFKNEQYKNQERRLKAGTVQYTPL